MDKKSLRNDLILIASLLLVAVISLVVILSTRTKDRLLAKVYVGDEIVEVIDLSKKEEKNYTVHGINGDLNIHTRGGAICVANPISQFFASGGQSIGVSASASVQPMNVHN